MLHCAVFHDLVPTFFLLFLLIAHVDICSVTVTLVGYHHDKLSDKTKGERFGS